MNTQVLIDSIVRVLSPDNVWSRRVVVGGKQGLIRASAWMSGTLVSFAAMAVAARQLSRDIGVFQVLFMRSAIGLLVVSAVVVFSRTKVISFRNIRLHILRNTSHFCGQVAWFHAVAIIPLAAVSSIEFTSPAWTAILAIPVLGERLTTSRTISLLLGTAGVLLVLRPGAELLDPAAVIMLGGAFAYGLSHVLTRSLASRDHSLCILYLMMLSQLALASVPAALGWVVPAVRQWPWIAAVGVTGLTAHYCLVRAMSIGDAAAVISMDFMRLPVMALVGLVFYGERVDRFLILGGSLILLGNLVNLWWQRVAVARKTRLG